MRLHSDLSNPPRPSALVEVLTSTFRNLAKAGDRVLVAFSGGPDSTALLWGLTLIAGDLGLDIHAAHFDHGLDPDSTRRAREARRLAMELDVPIVVENLAKTPVDRGAESHEALARRHRYAFLNRLATRHQARFVVTAHHADDQAETVLLRMLFGSGLEGLGAMRRVRGRLVRPLLPLRRAEIAKALQTSGLQPVMDPTNLDLSTPRNSVRASLLPHLERTTPNVCPQLCRLASVAQRASRSVELALRPLLELRPIHDVAGQPRGAACDRRAIETLPMPLVSPALALLHREAGVPYPASAAARAELERQLRAAGSLGCDCGAGWRWEGDAKTLCLTKTASSAGEFTYTLYAPGSVDIPELELRVYLTRGQLAPWMFRGRADRAGLADFGRRQVVVRNRRSGDRIRPLGCTRSRSLKDLLIDRRVPRRERDRLPLLVIDDEIAWVPGVTISESFRLRNDPSVWIAELERSDKTVLEPTGNAGAVT